MKLDKHKITLILAKKKMSRKQLAAAYGCTENRISTIMNCLEVRPETAVKFAEALDVSLEEILAD